MRTSVHLMFDAQVTSGTLVCLSRINSKCKQKELLFIYFEHKYKTFINSSSYFKYSLNISNVFS